ncbi:FAD-dependent oxidoreductase [Sphingomonas sp.]|uniref:FAD-dependent oxidoreductase n=1 Tax=Sphingomonas sp. TaxID=28214 RepID=UPI0031DA1C0E
MRDLHILVIGAGIGGCTAAIALRRAGFAVDMIEKDPSWSVYGVGIIQQSNVLRAMKALDIIDDYICAGYGFDHVSVFLPDGTQVARIPNMSLVDGYPANIGIGRPALHKVLGEKAISAGVEVRLGITVQAMEDEGDRVRVRFSDGSEGSYDLVVGADGLYSATRRMVLPDAPEPEFTGQSVWRYNLPRDEDVTGLCAFQGPTGLGLVPLSNEQMYMFVTTPEPGNPRFPREMLAAQMRERLAGVPAPRIRALAEQITDDAAVVYRPLETLFVEGAWHRGRTVLIGDAVHTTTPHLGQGAGMAIEDAIVLAEELSAHDDLEAALRAFHDRRYDRCRYIVEASRAICLGQLGLGPAVDNAAATREMSIRVAEPI